MTKTKTDSNQVSMHQHQDYTVKWHQIQNSKQKWIVIKRPFLVEINGHGSICKKLGVVGKGLIIWITQYIVQVTSYSHEFSNKDTNLLALSGNNLLPF